MILSDPSLCLKMQWEILRDRYDYFSDAIPKFPQAYLFFLNESLNCSKLLTQKNRAGAVLVISILCTSLHVPLHPSFTYTSSSHMLNSFYCLQSFLSYLLVAMWLKPVLQLELNSKTRQSATRKKALCEWMNHFLGGAAQNLKRKEVTVGNVHSSFV